MKQTYKAKRESLSTASIYEANGQQVGLINWPVKAIWSCENAAIGDPYDQDKSLGSYPALCIKDSKLIARRKLLTNHFFGNEYQISLWDENGEMVISALVGGSIWRKIKITHKNQNYFIKRTKFFQFNFVLQKLEVEIGQFKDVTPFLNFSSYREFSLSVDESVDPKLIIFSFFLAHNVFY